MSIDAMWKYDGEYYTQEQEYDMVYAMMDMEKHYTTYNYLFYDYLDDTGEWDVMSAVSYMIGEHKTPEEFLKECIEGIVYWLNNMPRDRAIAIYEQFGAVRVDDDDDCDSGYEAIRDKRYFD